jgi:hypothetical protein
MLLKRSAISEGLVIFTLYVALILPAEAFAAPIEYDVKIPDLGLGTLPPQGYFTYDPALARPFADFHVLWYGLDFDLTDAANSPAIRSDCGPFDPPQLSFALLSNTPSVCTVDSAVVAGFQGEERFFSFVGALDAELNLYSVEIGTSIGEPCSSGFCVGAATFGSFEISPRAATTPNPSALLTLIIGLASMGMVRALFPIMGYSEREKKLNINRDAS